MPNVQAARVSTFDDEDDFSSSDGFPDGQDSAAGAPHTVSVQALFRGVGIGAKILPFPHEMLRGPQSRWLLIAGTALVAASLAVFVAVAVSASVERAMTHSWAVDVAFVVSLLGGGGLLVAGMAKRRRPREQGGFLVGSVPEVDAPVDPRFVGADAHPLVAAVGDDWVVNATPQMRGAVSAAGQIRSLADLARDGSSSFVLPPGGRARLVCGATTFLLAAVAPPKRVGRPLGWWRRPEAVYVVGAAAAMGLFLLVVFSVPPDPRALSLDLISNENHLITFRITPSEEKKEALPSLAKTGAPGGKSAARAAGAEGAMGMKKSIQHDRAYSMKGPKDNLDPRMAAVLRAREAGILGVFKNMSGPLASVFSRESALGDAAEDAMGNLIGTQIGEAAGMRGLGMFGTGSKGGGTGDGLVGMGGPLRTIGHGPGPDGTQSGYGRLAGSLAPRARPKAPDILTGFVDVRGSLDKEIIRRIVRRHLNEVRFCYEQELTRQPSLAGRVVVQFMINHHGQVLSSVLQSSSMRNARVENCTVQAVRRWQFPEPQGGGLVSVSYPFSLSPAGQ